MEPKIINSHKKTAILLIPIALKQYKEKLLLSEYWDSVATIPDNWERD
jgi:hypothetical protein